MRIQRKATITSGTGHLPRTEWRQGRCRHAWDTCRWNFSRRQFHFCSVLSVQLWPPDRTDKKRTQSGNLNPGSVHFSMPIRPKTCQWCCIYKRTSPILVFIVNTAQFCSNSDLCSEVSLLRNSPRQNDESDLQCCPMPLKKHFTEVSDDQTGLHLGTTKKILPYRENSEQKANKILSWERHSL